MLRQLLLYLMVAYVSRFFCHPNTATYAYLPLTVQQLSPDASHPNPSQSVRLPIVTYPSLCNTYHQMLPTLTLPREAEDFHRGDRYYKHVPLLTYLIYLSPKEIY